MKNNYDYCDYTQEEMLETIIGTIRKVAELEKAAGIDNATGFDALQYALESWPEFDINTTVTDKKIGMYNWEHRDDISELVINEDWTRTRVGSPDRFYVPMTLDENGQILFSGRLIHYAILKNDLEAVKYLLSKGSVLVTENESYEDADYCKYYANSPEMLQFLNSTEDYIRAFSRRA